MLLRNYGLLLLFIFSTSLATPTKPLVVALDWFVNPNHAPLFVAKEQGFYKDQGIEVQFVPPADPTDAEKMLLTNNADIAITYQPALIIHASNGAPLVQIGTLINHPLNCLVVLETSSIKNLSALKGKKIGTSGTAIEKAQLQVMLKTAGLALQDIQLVNVRFNLVQGLLSHKIDAFLGAMRNFEPIQIEEQGFKVRLFFPEKYGFPPYDELVLAANIHNINDPRFAKFLFALQRGVDFLLKHPEVSWEKFVLEHPELNNSLNKKSWYQTLPFFAKKPGSLDKKRYENLTTFLQQLSK